MATRYAVYGGELHDPAEVRFRDLGAVEFVGWFDSYREARDAWKARAWMTVDNALMRFFIAPVDDSDLPPVCGPVYAGDNPVLKLALAARQGQDLAALARSDADAKFEAVGA